MADEHTGSPNKGITDGDRSTTGQPDIKSPELSNGHSTPAADRRPDGAGASEGQHTKYAHPTEDSAPPPEKEAQNPVRRIIGWSVVGVIAVIAIIWGISFWRFSQTHVGTDDAYVTGDLVNVSPIIAGTLDTLTVDEGDTVRQGQLIARLDDSGQRASLAQAQAAYNAANTEIPEAELNLQYEQQTSEAAIQRAQAGIRAQQAKTEGAQRQVTLSAQTVQSQVAQARSQIVQDQAQAAGVQEQVHTAQATLASQRQAVVTARKAAAAAVANIAAAQANADRASRDETRYAGLLQVAAVTQQQYDTAHAAAVSAQSQLAAVQDQAEQAQSQVSQAQANVVEAEAQVKTAQAQAAASEQQVQVAEDGLQIALANLTQVPIQQSNATNAVQQTSQADADLATAMAELPHVAATSQEVATYRAQALQAKAAVDDARVQEDDTYITSPTDGQVLKKAVNIGAALSPGQTIVTVAITGDVWVEANFKETQLTNVRQGQSAEVEVDAYPGKIFKGRVQAINDATGSSIALLPPDNATGNFTKVVQRIPVRIALIPAARGDDPKYATQADIARLGQGESVTATIDTGSK